MDLVYTNQERIDVGILQKYSFDCEMSTEGDYCTFQIETALRDNALAKGDFVYIEGTEFGGKVDSIKVDTNRKTVFADGRTWRGILHSKILQPMASVSGDVKEIISGLISSCDLTDLYEVTPGASGITVESYEIREYEPLYAEMMRLLSSVSAKVLFRWHLGKVLIDVENIVNYSNESEITSDLFEFVITTADGINHMVGTTQDGLVANQYVNASGEVTPIQFYFGSEEYAVKREFDAQTQEELEEKVAESLANEKIADAVSIAAYNINADIGDYFEVLERNTNISIGQYVVSKVVTINGEDIKTQYKVGIL